MFKLENIPQVLYSSVNTSPSTSIWQILVHRLREPTPKWTKGAPTLHHLGGARKTWVG
jgi:hypothetical protein